MPRVVLILPSATYRADAFLSAAHELDVDVIVASDAPQALAGVMGDHYLYVALDDPERASAAIVALGQRLEIDAVIAVDDVGGLVAALASKALHLRHHPPSAVEATRDKAVMRAAFSRAGVRQPDFSVLEDPTVVTIGERIGEISEELGYPVVVKATTLSGSRGIIRANTHAEARDAGERVFAIQREATGADAPILVERFIDGDEFALEGIVADGELEVIAVFDKPDPLDGPYFEETIYVTPSRADARLQDDIARTIAESCRALGLRDGPVHGEVRVQKHAVGKDDNDVVVLECAARTIGGRCAKVLSFIADKSLERLVIESALGIKRAIARPQGSAGGVMMLPIARTGRLVEIRGKDRATEVASIVGLEITVANGRTIRAVPEADRYLGFLFAKAETPALAERALRLAYQKLEIEIDPEEVHDVLQPNAMGS